MTRLIFDISFRRAVAKRSSANLKLLKTQNKSAITRSFKQTSKSLRKTGLPLMKK